MFFRRFWPFVALLGLLGACTPEANPPQSASAANAASGKPSPLPREIEREVGAIYASPPMQAQVDRIGQRLVSQSGLGIARRVLGMRDGCPNAQQDASAGDQATHRSQPARCCIALRSG